MIGKVQIFLFCFSCFLISCDIKKERKNTSEDEEEAVAVMITTIEEEKEKTILDKLYEQDNYWVDIPITYHYVLSGKIDNKYSFIMEFDINSDTITEGSYQYSNQKGSIDIKGTLKGNGLLFVEEQGHKFEGYFDYKTGHVSGKWYSVDGERILPFSMSNMYGATYPQFDFKVHLYDRREGQEDFIDYGISAIQYVNRKTGEEMSVGIEAEAYEWCYNLRLQDFNFDGYLDIALVQWLPAYPPLKYMFLLYDPESETFNHTDILEDMYTLPHISYKSKKATVYMEGGNGYQRIYLFEDGEYYKFYEHNWWISNPNTADDDGIEIDDSHTYYKIEDGQSLKISKEDFEQINGYHYE